MSNTNNSTSGGVGFGGLLATGFITLKLCKVIDWSWWWVLSPLWIPFAIVAAILLCFGVVFLVAHAMDLIQGKAK